MTPPGFKDRTEAGRRLAADLQAYARREDVLVLGLPRGGVPVAIEVAEALQVPMDILLVRKLGLPGQEELAMGAIASGGGRVLNEDVLRQARVGEQDLQRVVARETRELARREREYREGRPPVRLRGRVIIVVDDGAATGASMRVAIAALREGAPARIVVGLPVAPPDAVVNLRKEADEVVAVLTPEYFLGVGRWYGDFRQVTDAEVRALLSRAWARESGRAHEAGDGPAGARGGVNDGSA